MPKKIGIALTLVAVSVIGVAIWLRAVGDKPASISRGEITSQQSETTATHA